MKARWGWATTGVVGVGSLLGVFVGTSRGGAAPAEALDPVAEAAASEDPQKSAPAIAALRARGAAGLEALLARLPDKQPVRRGSDAAALRLLGAIDAVAQQYDAHLSRLFWFTDMDEAKRVARAEHRPILSLRLLGKLDEELSCANSRFFRTLLYANGEVSKLLRERFVLHWQSERPVPKVTIDFGDGRVLKTTITGNSIHYVLDAEGRPLDALPGLYGPKGFQRDLARLLELAARLEPLDDDARQAELVRYHRERSSTISSEYLADTRLAGFPDSALYGDDPKLWQALARAKPELQRGFARLLEMSGIMPVPVVDAKMAMRLTATKAVMETPVLNRISSIDTVAEDTVRNEFLLHRQIHNRLSEKARPMTLEMLNEWVYSSLFLTPRSDPWLGLMPYGVIREVNGRREAP